MAYLNLVGIRYSSRVGSGGQENEGERGRWGGGRLNHLIMA